MSPEDDDREEAKNGTRSEAGETPDAEKSEPVNSDNGEGPVKTARPRRLMNAYDVVMTVVLLLLWIAPITYVGAASKDVRWLPAWLRHQHRVSCLFTNEVRGWQTYRMEVQQGGDSTWKMMSEEGFFDMPVFGYRTRLHRLLGHSYRRGKGLKRMREVAEYIRDRHTILYPNEPRLDAVRFVRIYMNNDMLSKQTGRFKPMAPEEVPKSYVLYFGETRFDGKRPTDGGFGRRTKKKSPARPKRKTGK